MRHTIIMAAIAYTLIQGSPQRFIWDRDTATLIGELTFKVEGFATVKEVLTDGEEGVFNENNWHDTQQPRLPEEVRQLYFPTTILDTPAYPSRDRTLLGLNAAH